MRNPCLVSAALVLMLGVLVGDSRANVPPDVETAIQSLQSQAPQVKFITTGSRVTRVYGQPLSTATTAEGSAEQFRLNQAGVFGTVPDELQPLPFTVGGPLGQPVMYQPETGTYKFTLFRYGQQKDGIPVFRSNMRLLVFNDADFPLVLAASSLRPLGDFAVDASALAQSFAPNTLNTSMERFSQPETVIWAGAGLEDVEPVLARTFIGERGSMAARNYEKWLFVVDPASGRVLYRENRIIQTDVTGNVSGLATEGPKADLCADEVLTPMAWATARIVGGSTAYANANGDFVVPNPGTTAVTVESPLNGDYFAVNCFLGSQDMLSQSVTPPGPADFVHNAANSSEYVRAMTNGYIQANVIRDFALTYNPDYPTISTETDFPVWVNRTDNYCPGNAWYDYHSINFCASGGGHPNTAFSVIVHHEYGHHMVQCAGSGQGQYGEGMADCVGVLITDEPVLAYGWDLDCNAGMRTADNDYQYPCVGEIHDCGQLLSGCIWSTRNELMVNYPATYLDILSNLTVNSILLHTDNLITPQIALDFVTLDDDDADFGNATPHWNEICAGFGAHGMDCPEIIPCSVPADCNDGSFCNGVGDCYLGMCVYYEYPCDDLNLCTIDECDEETDTCTNTPDNSVCPPMHCARGWCDAAMGCVYVQDDSVGCDDGVFCNGAEYCDFGVCYMGPDPCPAPGAGCDEIHDLCVLCDDNGTCELGEDCDSCPNDCFRTGMTCGNAVCEAGNGEDCYSCPEDCNSSMKGQPPKWFCCSDGSAPLGVTCDDPRCTDDGNTCTMVPIPSSCCGDLFCEGPEDGGNCSIDCEPQCQSGTECVDGDPCTDDVCQNGFCVNPPIDCGDGDACTDDTCSGGVCLHDPAVCNDNDDCTDDTCDTVWGCMYWQIDCDDDNVCTADTCRDGECIYAELVCDDENECTIDTCDPVTACVFTPIPGCGACLPKGEPCSTNAQCCSNRCQRGACK
ncbi:MAG TPA: hypothetical protein VM243_12505 [Phycisphaerae bacterium]|nr:hypothetical protein [Phycisphaerae bacterium]